MADDAKDEVRFSGDTYTHGGDLQAFADRIYVNPASSFRRSKTRDPYSEGEDIDFRARRIDTTDR